MMPRFTSIKIFTNKKNEYLVTICFVGSDHSNAKILDVKSATILLSNHVPGDIGRNNTQRLEALKKETAF